MISVVAAIALRDGQVMVARRAIGQRQAGLWEFPGGKVEAGESDAQALARELHEELNVAAIIGEEFARTQYDYADGSIELIGLFTELPDLEYVLSVHDQIDWLPIGHLAMVELAPADVALAQQLMQRFA
ncbi:8-oxo-dGTP diphosphatase [Paraperlucidibaca baekdonensis]|uniref:8-oxo-dGTP diphosphatase n=1 Tax=Paraperlucidibaca baekdonensis TaxID=748120 RepID=A0A3E0H373_9GAMM|nr:(deoxy)nucleoside triphosphate pyrophosphohydrolase [Paraperlucidibaca baekdonensis]REH36677.1 8-oxo-dGTP diphosphatase [Paraperlucidibaca baekdonensis]